MMKAEKPTLHPRTSFWRSLPAAHKKRLWAVLGAYLAVVVLISAFVLARADHMRDVWNQRIPQAQLSISATAPLAAETPPDTTEHFTTEHLQETPDTTDGHHAEPSGDTSGNAASLAPVIDPPATAVDDAPLVTPPAARKGAYIAIILTNAGISASSTEKAFADLPADIAFAFSPYTKNIDAWVKKSGLAKREMLMLVPMEPANYPKDDPGPQTLLTRLGVHENEENLKAILSRVPAGTLAGVMNNMGGRFLADPRSSLPVFSLLMTKSLPFIENPERSIPQAESTAKIAGAPYMSADLQIDKGTVNEDSIRRKLAELEQIAAAKGTAIGIAEAYPVTIRSLKAWADSLDSRGIRLVPLTTVFKEKERQGTNDQPQEPTAPY